MPVTVKFDPASQSPQAQIIADVTLFSAGVMTPAMLADLLALVAGSVSNVTGTLPITSTGGFTPDIAINPATNIAAGSMSAADKSKLDGLFPESGGVNVYSPSGVGAPLRPPANAVGATPTKSVVITNFDSRQLNYAGTYNAGVSYEWYDFEGNVVP
jgi:hypothetical protein